MAIAGPVKPRQRVPAREAGMARKGEGRRQFGAWILLGIALALPVACSVPPAPRESCRPECPPQRLPHPLY